MDMGKLRFGDKISYSFLIGPGVESRRIMVPPLFLQPLIENPIWNGILALEQGGEIVARIDSNPQYITYRVEDKWCWYGSFPSPKVEKQ